MVVLYYKSLPFQGWQSQLSGEGRYIVFYLSRDFMWPRDRRVTHLCWQWSLSLTHKSAKCGGHRSCGSGGLIFSQLYCKKKDTYDYLITKCDNAISQAFFDIFRITECGKVILLESVTDCYYKVRQVLRSVTDIITKCVKYYKM